MKSFIWILLLLLFAALLIRNQAAGGEPAKAENPPGKAPKAEAKEVKTDAKTAGHLDRSEELAYLLGKEGVKKASFKAAAMIKTPDYPEGVRCEFQYQWDGTKRALQNPPEGTIILNIQLPKGLIDFLPEAGFFDSFFLKKISWKEEFAGCELVSNQEKGKTRIKVVNGKSKNEVSEILLNEDRMPEEIVEKLYSKRVTKKISRIRGLKTSFSYVKFGNKFALFKKKVEDHLTDVDQTLALAVEYASVKSYHVPSRLTQTKSLPGGNAITTITIGDWKIE